MVIANPNPLPQNVQMLLAELQAPPRLQKHLTLVYNTALLLTEKLARTFQGLSFSEKEIHFGAATHDIGKAVITAELYGEGNRHEQAGYELLLRYGIPEPMARFARTHGCWQAPDRTLEDRLVTLADKLWKGKRIPELEEQICTELSTRLLTDYWEVFIKLDKIASELAAGADSRLAWQSL